MSPPKIEPHNKLPLSTLRSLYLPSGPLGNETHSVTLETSSSLSDVVFTRCFELVRDNLQELYKRSSMGWSAVRKKKEMKHPAMRYLILRTKTAATLDGEVQEQEEQGQKRDQEPNEREHQESWEDDDEDPVKIVGFLSFMITEEEKEPVIYIYEIQLTPDSQNKGLGKLLMNIAENYGKAVGMPKIMLTCFSDNVGAKRFYHRIGFEIDAVSPVARTTRSGEVREPNYYLLSKYFEEKKDKEQSNVIN